MWGGGGFPVFRRSNIVKIGQNGPAEFRCRHFVIRGGGAFGGDPCHPSISIPPPRPPCPFVPLPNPPTLSTAKSSAKTPPKESQRQQEKAATQRIVKKALAASRAGSRPRATPAPKPVQRPTQRGPSKKQSGAKKGAAQGRRTDKKPPATARKPQLVTKTEKEQTVSEPADGVKGVCVCCTHASLRLCRTKEQGPIGGGGGTRPPPLQGAQPMPCPPDGKRQPLGQL